MQIVELGLKGAWIAHSPIHNDNRGYFREWFKAGDINNVTGQTFNVKQANVSYSDKGVLRGIHYSRAREGQGKWITCVTGSIWDVVVDVRPASPTYGKWVGSELSSKQGDSIFISEGLGHGFIALEDNTQIVYLLTSPYSPEQEFGINPLDPDLAINWPIQNMLLSEKDALAPSLREQRKCGRL
jgi:dTDP-4-dehydrorhamnose 3,5-epimerase